MSARVSVVFAAYNATWCIEHALDSVLAQTVAPIEILVCDDGSTDGTPDLIERRYGDRVTVLRLPHRNAAATRKIGLDRARGDWLAFMDADDTWRPEKLEHQLAFLARHPQVRWLGTDGVLTSADGVMRESWFADYFDPVRDLVGDLTPLLVDRCFTLMSSMMVERVAYHEVGGLQPEIPLSHDYDLWLRLAVRYPGAMMSERLIEYFYHPGSLSRRVEERGIDDLGIMQRLAAGEITTRPDVRRSAARRAAALEFDLAIHSFRAGRLPEARERLRRAAAAGPGGRRVLALLGAWAPAGMLPILMNSDWVKHAVRLGRQRTMLLRPELWGGLW